MTEIGEGGPDLDPGTALYADSPLDYLDTGREQARKPPVDPQLSRTGAFGEVPDREPPEVDPALVEAFGDAFALLVETAEGNRSRRRMVMSLAAAERARHRAELRGHRCRIAVVRLSLVAELERAPLSGGDPQCPG